MNRNRFRIAAALLFAAAAFSLASPASAFIRIARQATPTDPVVQAHWLDTDFPLPSVIDPANSDQPPATALAVAQASAQAWQDINTSYMTVNAHQFTGTPELQPALAFDGQNSLFFDATGVNFPVAGVIAFVRSVIDGSTGQTLDADLVFNDRDFFSSVSTPNLTPAPAGQTSVDLQAVLTHEYGHYFGLDHTSIAGATMVPFISNDISQRSLELDDRAGNSTIYPESASRPGGLSPGAVDFAATTGTVTGTVLNGYNNLALFGAHVEAFNLAAPTPANEISAISGELTLRNGQGEYMIHGLPPGNYAIAIVPLDGIHTVAADANIGGPYAGLDINFEPEFWNGANESGNGFNDNANDYAPIVVSAGANTGGVNFISNTFPGRVTIAQYGAFENVVTFRSTGYLAVRFDPPFAPPYTINNIEFPSFTFNGVPAPFLSAKLCALSQATGLPDIANPLFNQTPFPGNPNGVNTVPLNLSVTSANQTFFWVLEFPSQTAQPGFPNNFPFVRMDFVQMERGHFANSYTVPLSGPGAGILIDRNIAVSMTCQLSSPSKVPIEAPSNLGANRQLEFTEFSNTPSPDRRADGFDLPLGSTKHMNLIARPIGAPGTYTTVMTIGGKKDKSMKLEPPPPSNVVTIWSSQADDVNHNMSLQSNVTVTGLSEDADEPNGKAKGDQATLLTTPVANRPESYSPAGDQDFYEITATIGQVIDASAVHVGALDGRNDPDYVMFLYDKKGNIVAFNDDFTGLDPRIVYTVPPPQKGNVNQSQVFRIQVTDFYGSLLNPTGAPRIPSPLAYNLNASVTAAAAPAAAMAAGARPDVFDFVNSGPNPANPISKLMFIIPQNQGAVNVHLRIYDVNGRLVRTLVSGVREPGPHTAVWNGRDDLGRGVASGNYYARIEMGQFVKNTQLTILK